MESFDWIVVGNGLAGAVLSYELACRDLKVLLLDDGSASSATRCSYGGIAYWAAQDAMTKILYREGIERHRQLEAELDSPTEFRELDLLLTFPPGVEGEQLLSTYSEVAIAPTLIDAATAQELEPQLSQTAVGGALTVKHGHVSPHKIVAAFNQAFRRRGGQHIIASVRGLVRIGNRVTGVLTPNQAYTAGSVAVCVGAYSRQLLKQARLSVPCLYSHAELVKLEPMDTHLRAMIMPALADRFGAEATAGDPDCRPLWQQPQGEIVPPVLDAGAIQFLDGTTYIGQISRFRAELEAAVDPDQSEAEIRQGIVSQLPCLADRPGQWFHTLVAFTSDGLPLVGPLPEVTGLHLFSGFSSPFAMVMPVARRFVQELDSAQSDELVGAMAVDRQV